MCDCMGCHPYTPQFLVLSICIADFGLLSLALLAHQNVAVCVLDSCMYVFCVRHTVSPLRISMDEEVHPVQVQQ